MLQLRLPLLALVGFLPCLTARLSAAVLPEKFAETEVVGNLDPTSMSFAPDGRLFVCEKDGVIRVVKDDQLLPDPFLVLDVNNENERGLQSIAFDPHFEHNAYVYVYYTAAGSEVRNRVSRFTANGDVVMADSERVLLETEPLRSGIHNGGALHFRDGLLYIATGESGVGSLAQDLGSKLGKILRVRTDGSAVADNPFVDTPGADPTVWAYGLRNPFTFAFDPETGTMFINDVGQAEWEEINEGIAGANYGWPASEGPSDDPAVTDPFLAYHHEDGGCAITGGAFYRPRVPLFPDEYLGRYFFADYCSGTIWTIDPEDAADWEVFATDIDRCIDLDVAPDGSLYYIARGGIPGGSQEANTSSDNGRIFRVAYTGSRAPTVSVQADDLLLPVGEVAEFTIAASGSTPLSYQWFRDGEAIPGATSPELEYGPVTLADDQAVFTCEVTNEFGSAESAGATLSVTTNTRPVPVITAPAEGLLYRAGEDLVFSGDATDWEDGDNLPDSAFTWRVVFHHDTHTHPALAPTSGARSGRYTIPSTIETSADVWYRIYLTVIDSEGLSQTTYRDVHPQKVTLSFATSPEGLPLYLDGVRREGSFAVEAVAGVIREVTVDDPAVAGDQGYRFEGWADGVRAAARSLRTPGHDTGYIAHFVEDSGSRGTGLRGAYYSDQERGFEGQPTLVRVGEVINFPWGPVAPHEGVSADFFTVRWTGQIAPPQTGMYTFYTYTDDGTRLWVDGQLLVDQWVNQGGAEWAGSIFLQAGQRYSVHMDYYEGTGGAAAALQWSGPNLTKQIVPRERLFPTLPAIHPIDRIAVESVGGEDYLTLTYTRPRPPLDHLSYAVESAGDFDPASWSPAIILEGFPLDNENGTETIQVRDAEPLSESAGSRFMRLRVEEK